MFVLLGYAGGAVMHDPLRGALLALPVALVSGRYCRASPPPGHPADQAKSNSPALTPATNAVHSSPVNVTASCGAVLGVAHEDEAVQGFTDFDAVAHIALLAGSKFDHWSPFPESIKIETRTTAVVARLAPSRLADVQ